MHALIVTYAVAGDASRAVEHAELCEQLAPALAALPGLKSMTWLENRVTGRRGAFYVFDTKAAFDGYVASELFGALHPSASVRDLRASDFSIDSRLSAATDSSTSPKAGR